MPIFNAFTGSFWAGRRTIADDSTATVTLTNLVSYIDVGDIASYPGTGALISDLSGFSIGATIVGDPQYSADNGGSLIMDEVNTYVITESLRDQFDLGTGEMTIDIWLRPTENGVVINEQGSITAPTWFVSQLEIVNGILRTGLWNGSAIISTPLGAVQLGNWQNYTISYDGARLRGYINGALMNSLAVIKVNPWSENQEYHLSVMGGTSLGFNLGDGTRLAGNFGLMRVYKSALSQSEIRDNFNATRSKYSV